MTQLQRSAIDIELADRITNELGPKLKEIARDDEASLVAIVEQEVGHLAANATHLVMPFVLAVIPWLVRQSGRIALERYGDATVREIASHAWEIGERKHDEADKRSNGGGGSFASASPRDNSGE
jgi:hypothetical protein